jgi:hypothetical protein
MALSLGSLPGARGGGMAGFARTRSSTERVEMQAPRIAADSALSAVRRLEEGREVGTAPELGDREFNSARVCQSRSR